MKGMPESRRLAITNAAPESLVRLYTYQHPGAWKAAQERGYLTGAGVPPDGLDESFAAPYEWMRSEMAKRVEDFSGDLPIWAYIKRQTDRGKGWRDECDRIIALVPRKRILLSDFDLWHYPLNNWRVTFSEAEFDEDEQGDHSPTWHHIFDMRDRVGEARRWIGQVNVVQACVDRIYLNEVVSFRPAKRTPKGPIL